MSLFRDLRAIGIAPGMTLLVHSSMSSLGWVCGAAQAIVEALTGALGPNGTLVMPAFSGGLSNPEHWSAPPVPEKWWPVIRSTMPAYDKHATPTRMIGAIPELFRALPGVLRSDHPHDSFAARGPRAPSITESHEIESPMGEGSPLARLYELDARVLLLGCDHSINSSMHLAEERAQWPGKTIVEQGAPVMVDGRRRWVTFRALDYDSDDFGEIGESFSSGTRGTVACADALLFRQRDVVDFAVDWIERNRA